LAGLLLAAERAVDSGADILRHGRAHIGALIGKGDRDFATSVDLQIESAIRALLADADRRIPFLGEEGGGERAARASWVLDPIDGTINFSRDSPLCTISLSLVVEGQPVLGVVDAPFDHVHLTEIDHSVVQNPLQPGHLTPYRDATVPIVDGLYLRDPSGTVASR